jgi:hypothetical protein
MEGRRKADAWGTLTAARPGGKLGVVCKIGGGVEPGGRPAYGFVKNEASEVMDAMGSRKDGCLPLEFRFGGVTFSPCGVRFSHAAACDWAISVRGDGGRGVDVVGIADTLATVMGGLLWKRQKMCTKLARSFAASTWHSGPSWPSWVYGKMQTSRIDRPSRDNQMI